MGSFTAYMIEASLFLSLLFVAYKLSLGRLKCFSLMRGVLLLIYPLCLIVPALIKLSIKEPSVATVPGFSGLTTISHIETAVPTNRFTAGEIIVMITIGGMIVTGLITAVGLIRLIRLCRSARKSEIDGYRVYLLSDTMISPFSFVTRIYVNSRDVEESNSMLLTHEMAHIRMMHWADLALSRSMCILQWWNPFAWLMDKELHAIHEFQADQAVVGEGYDMKEYQYFLIRKATGTRLQTLADSLNHSKLKTRLTMMKKENSSVKSRMAGMMMIPAVAIGVALLSLPAVARLTGEIRNVAITFPHHSESEGKVNEKIPNVEIGKGISSGHTLHSSPGIMQEQVMAQNESSNDGDKTNKGDEELMTGSDGSHSGKTAGNETVEGKPRYEIDGVVVAEDYDINSVNPSSIKSMTIVKNNPAFPNGLIKIELQKNDEAIKSESKPNTESNRKADDALLVSVNHIDNVNGTHLVFHFLTDEEIHLKDIVWTIDGKDYKPESVSSSFSKSGNHGYQTVKIDLPTTIKKFRYGKDKVSFTRDNGERESFIISTDMLTSPN